MHKLLYLKLKVLKLKLAYAKTDTEKKSLLAEVDQIHQMVDDHIKKWSDHHDHKH